MNNNSGYLDIGVTANTSKPSTTPPLNTEGLYLFNYGQNDSNQALGYARVTIPLGHRPARLDCSRMYELEIARMKREIEMLKLAAE